MWFLLWSGPFLVWFDAVCSPHLPWWTVSRAFSWLLAMTQASRLRSSYRFLPLRANLLVVGSIYWATLFPAAIAIWPFTAPPAWLASSHCFLLLYSTVLVGTSSAKPSIAICLLLFALGCRLLPRATLICLQTAAITCWKVFSSVIAEIRIVLISTVPSSIALPTAMIPWHLKGPPLQQKLSLLPRSSTFPLNSPASYVTSVPFDISCYSHVFLLLFWALGCTYLFLPIFLHSYW